MELSWLAATLHGGAALGLLAISLVPLRTGDVVRQHWRLRQGPAALKFVFVILLGFALALFAVDVGVISNLFDCMTTFYCGANRVSGLIKLTVFGVLYLLFETVAWVARDVVRYLDRKARRSHAT